MPSPFEDQVEPVSYDSYPDELDADGLLQVKPEREEHKERVPQVCSEGHEKEPTLSILVVGLQVLGCVHPVTVHVIHERRHNDGLHTLSSYEIVEERVPVASLRAGWCTDVPKATYRLFL